MQLKYFCHVCGGLHSNSPSYGICEAFIKLENLFSWKKRNVLCFTGNPFNPGNIEWDLLTTNCNKNEHGWRQTVAPAAQSYPRESEAFVRARAMNLKDVKAVNAASIASLQLACDFWFWRGWVCVFWVNNAEINNKRTEFVPSINENLLTISKDRRSIKKQHFYISKFVDRELCMFLSIMFCICT